MLKWMMSRMKNCYENFRNKSEKKLYYLSSGEQYYSGKGVGEMWDAIGLLQFEYLTQQGLSPVHNFLDIGCGSLRGGVHFIRYLNDGNYHGMDKQRWLLTAGQEVEIPRYNLTDKKVTLIQSEEFEFHKFQKQFDFALAQSVFTHLTWNSILKCLANVQQVLAPGGRFYATFFEDKQTNYSRPIHYSDIDATTYPDRDPFHYKFNVFMELAVRVKLDISYVGEWEHPRHQMMMVFTKKRG